MGMDLKTAEAILKKAVSKSEELDICVAIAIFDSESELVLFQMDGRHSRAVRLNCRRQKH